MNEKPSDGQTFRRKGFGEMVVFNRESAQVTGLRRACSTVNLNYLIQIDRASEGSVGLPERLGSEIATPFIGNTG